MKVFFIKSKISDGYLQFLKMANWNPSFFVDD